MLKILKIKTIVYSLSRQEIYLLASSFIFAMFWVFTQHLTFNGDSGTYLHYAKWIMFKQGISSIWYLRSPGLPLVLILSGVVTFANFIGFMLLQAVVSVANVWLFYQIAKIMQPRIALAAAWISVATCVPFIFSSMVMTEHWNLFGHLLLIFALLKFKVLQNSRLIWLVALSNAFLFILRPSNYYLFTIVLVFLAIFSQDKWRTVLKFLLIYGTISLIYSMSFGLLKLAQPGSEGLSAAFQGYRTFLYQPYIEGKLQASNTELAHDILETIEYYSHTIPTASLNLKLGKEYFAPYIDDRDVLFQQTINQPNGYYYNFIAEALVARYGRKATNAMLAKLVFNYFATNPSAIVQLLKSTLASSSNNYAGQMLFYPLMLKAQQTVLSEHNKPNSKIRATNGPATQQILHHVEDFVLGEPENWQNMQPSEYFADFKNNPYALLANIEHHPNHSYHWFMWQIMDRAVGPTAAAKLFMDAAKEGYIAHPISILAFMDDFITYFVGPDVTYRHGSRITFLPNPGVGEKSIPVDASTRMIQQIQNPILDVGANFWPQAYTVLGMLWLILKPIIIFLALAGFIMSFGSKNFSKYSLVLAIIVYNALIVCVFADPFFRYSALTWLLSLLLSIQTVYSWVENRLAGIHGVWYNSNTVAEGR